MAMRELVMKRIIAFTLVLLMAFFLGCGSTTSAGKTDTAQTIDVDLSMFSKVAAYAQVCNILDNASDYIGKRVKISGFAGHAECGDCIYYACCIMDSTGCCSVGLEYVLNNGSYPADDTNIVVEGILEEYTDQYGTYFTLNDANVTIKKK